VVEALVVGRRPSPKGDLLLFLVSPQGAFTAIARSALRSSGQAGRLSLFHHLRLQLYQRPQAELPTVTQVELIGRLFHLEEPSRFPAASFLAELAFRLASPESAPKIWPLLVSGLRGISRSDPGPALAWAGWRILQAAGLAPNLEGEGWAIQGGQRSVEGIYVGPQGMKALQAILTRPGREALSLLDGESTERLLELLRLHALDYVGELRSLRLRSSL